MTPIERLVDYFGGQTKTALALGVSQTAVSYWVSGIPLMSAEKAFKAEELTADKSPLVRFVLAISQLVNPPPNPALSHRKRK